MRMRYSVVAPLGLTGALILAFAIEGQFLVAAVLLIVLVAGIFVGIGVSQWALDVGAAEILKEVSSQPTLKR